ncbi:MAG: hypothetical protein P9M07_02695 [Candidatus Aceula meridiana]|nr:hypothetical protein [Candidatus Aceula meridiana]
MRERAEITHYNFNNLLYSTFFITGFLENSESLGYKFRISKEIPEELSGSLEDDDGKKIRYSMCLFKVKQGNEQFFFCIDTYDRCDSHKKEDRGYHLPLLKRVKYYFKVNYNKEAIEADLNLKDFKTKIYPAFPFSPIKPSALLSWISLIYQNSLGDRTFVDFIKMVRHFFYTLTVDHIKKMRRKKKRFDILFMVVYYREEVHAGHNEFRYQIMKELQKYSDINAVFGFVSRRKIPGKFGEFRVPSFPLRKYLDCLTSAKVGIYVRGVHNCFSFKFSQLLYLGMPIVGQTILNNKEAIMKYPYFDEQFAYDSPKEIVKRAVELLNDPERLKKLGESNARVFDEHFTPKRVTYDIIKIIENKLTEEREKNSV